MKEGDKLDVVSAKLVRLPWWRAALGRLGVGRDRGARGYEETLNRYAQRDVTDTLGEEDVKAWLAMLSAEPQGRAPRGRRARGPAPKAPADDPNSRRDP